MIRGTTPTHIFKTDMDISEATEIYITYKQDDIVIEKTIEDCTVTPEEITVKLSQEETLAFKQSGYVADVQIRAKFPNGTAVASNIMTIEVSKILKDGEI